MGLAGLGFVVDEEHDGLVDLGVETAVDPRGGDAVDQLFARGRKLIV